MDRAKQLSDLQFVLTRHGYPHMDRLRKMRSTLEIPIQDFFCIVALLGNAACRPFMAHNPFPKIYLNKTCRVSPDDQNLLCDRICSLAEKLKFGVKFTKSQILSATSRYNNYRADFLKRMCDYLDQVLETPPRAEPRWRSRLSLSQRSSSLPKLSSLRSPLKAG